MLKKIDPKRNLLVQLARGEEVLIPLNKKKALKHVGILMGFILLLFSFETTPNGNTYVRTSFTVESDTVEKVRLEAQELLKLGADNYTHAAELLVTHKHVIDSNTHIFPNMPTEDIFAVMCAIFMSESKDKRLNKPGTSTAYISGYNGWGMKCGSNWKGEATYTGYWEIVKGKRVDFKKGEGGRANAWRAFDSLEEAMLSWFDLVSKKRYETARQAKSAEDCVEELVSAGYATSPRTSKMWRDIMRKYPFREVYLETNTKSTK